MAPWDGWLTSWWCYASSGSSTPESASDVSLFHSRLTSPLALAGGVVCCFVFFGVLWFLFGCVFGLAVFVFVVFPLVLQVRGVVLFIYRKF